MHRNLLNSKSKTIEILFTSFIGKAHFSYSLNLHKQWLKTIKDKIIRSNINQSDLRDIDERIMNIEDLKELCHTVALNAQVPPVIELLSNKISSCSGILLEDQQYKNRKSSFLEILESFTLIRGYEYLENTVNELQKCCYKFLENKETVSHPEIKSLNYNEIGHICRILSAFIKQDKNLDNELIKKVISQVDEIVNDKSLRLDFVILMKYLEFIEEVRRKNISSNDKVSTLSEELKTQIQNKIQGAGSHSQITITAEDLLMLNDGIFYFIDDPKFIDLLLQELTYASLLGTEISVSSSFTMDRVLGDFSQMLLTLDYNEKIMNEKILDKLYEYLIILMRISNKFTGDTTFAKNLPALWFKYVYTLPNKSVLAQVEQQFNLYVENFLKASSAREQNSSQQDLTFELVESFFGELWKLFANNS